MGLVYALVSLGLGMIWGVMDIINFAHTEYVMLAMYATYFAWRGAHLDPLGALPGVVLLGFGAGVATYLVVIRRIMAASPVTQIFATFGLLLFLRYTAFAVFGPNFLGIRWPLAAGALVLAGVPVDRAKVYAALAGLATYGLLFSFLQRTKVGKALQATAQNPTAALALGIEVERMYMLAWGLSIDTAAVAGVFLLPFASVVVRGFGTLFRPLVGGVAIGLIEGIAGTLIAPTFKLVFVFAAFLLALFLRPTGILGRDQA